MNELLRPVNLVMLFLPGLLVGITLFSMRDTSKINTGDVFSSLFVRCLDYVETRIDFDTTGLKQGGLSEGMNGTIERDSDRRLYHEPKELLLVELNNNETARSCVVRVSSYGKRPPESSTGRVIHEFMQVKDRLWEAGTHEDYQYKDYIPGALSFGTVKRNQHGCKTLSTLFTSSGDKSYFKAVVFQAGVACS